MVDLLIRGARLVTPREVFAADIAISGARIGRLLAPGETCIAEKVIDAGGLYVLPGLIDAHVHLREPGLAHKETIATGTRAAACGGVTTVLDMPNTVPPVTDVDALLAKGHMIEGQAHVDVGLFAALTPGALPRIRAMVEAGSMGFKLFLGPTTGDLEAPGWGELLDMAAIVAEMGVPFVVHAEDREMIEYWTPRGRRKGSGYDDFLDSRPEFGEVAVTAMACRLAGYTGAAVHLAHVALAEAVNVIRQARKAGWPVTAETCPPYLFLTSDDYGALGTTMKVLPPIRDGDDQNQLWRALAEGWIDIVATDHAPHLEEDKAGDIWEAAAGALGVETWLPLMLEAARQGRCSLCDIVRLCCANPAAVFGLPDKGSLGPGKWADMVLVDMDRRWCIQPDKLHSIARNSPFVGREGQGVPVATFLRGQLVASEGEPVGEPRGHWERLHQGRRL